MRHRDALQIENGDASKNLRSGFQDSELENDDRGLEDLLHWILPGIPVPQSIDHHPSAALGPVRRHRHHIVLSDVLHLHWVHILVDLWVFLFEVVVVHYLSKDPLRGRG